MRNLFRKIGDISYETMYKAIGLLGMLLPLLIILRIGYFPSSISESYYTDARDIFVGIMSSLGLFFITSKGYNGKDTWCNIIAGIMAIIVPLFGCEGPFSWLHFTAAIIFFSSTCFMCLFIFPKVRTEKYTKCNKPITKILRNIIYRICGIFIILGMFLIIITKNIGLGEVMMLESFGIAYLIQSKTFKFLND